MTKNSERERRAVTPTGSAITPMSQIDPSSAFERTQELFLPVHGHVELYPEELAIIDHPSFQRLRRVRQLGLAHMVFPGATHTRFEHSVGAVHVAQLIIDHVNKNYRNREDDHARWELRSIDDATARFIRLAALLHDVGHLPYGHTLEDELNHLRSHDGPERLQRVAKITYPNHEVEDGGLFAKGNKPKDGWTLEALVNSLYAHHAKMLGLTEVNAFEILAHIVCKPPKKEGPELTSWAENSARLKTKIHLSVCRDIVGNTICADFLDYLYRDWYHLGKPLYNDKRLYQYMEVRQISGGGAEPKFVINVGATDKVRHDAITDILVLLNARYKLAETVLFHRTKLALTGLLDRCLLEIADLYAQTKLGNQKFIDQAEALLLVASDDGIPLMMKEMAAGGDEDGKKLLLDAIQKESSAIKNAISGPQNSLLGGQVQGRLEAQRELIFRLTDKLRDRDVYTLVYKLRMADFAGPHNPKNSRLSNLLHIYKNPSNRLGYLRKLETLCLLPAGSLVINCPPDAAMNAKIAKVNLYLEDEVKPFDEYEEHGQPNLTGGTLTAQINRFYELWAASVYIDRRVWDEMSLGERKNLKSVLREFLFQLEAGKDPAIARAQMQPSLDALRKRASRAASSSPEEDMYRGTDFPSGMPFDLPKE